MGSLNGITAFETASAAVESPARYEATPPVVKTVDDVDDFGADPVEAARPGMDLRIPADAVRSLAAPILRWAPRVFAAAAVLAILAGAGWMARPYVTRLLTVAKTGTVVLESLPPGSDVFVDGVALGPSPLTTELSTGSHVVEFRRGDATRKLEIDVAGGQADRRASRLDRGAHRAPDREVRTRGRSRSRRWPRTRRHAADARRSHPGLARCRAADRSRFGPSHGGGHSRSMRRSSANRSMPDG